MNASGPLSITLDELEKLAQSWADIVVLKSCTIDPREGNVSPRYHCFEGGSINSMGLPNLWYEAYVEYSHILSQKYNKPLMASVSGMKPDDYPVLVEAFENHAKVVAIEINLSCPNIEGKPQIGYDFQTSREILEKVCKIKQHSYFWVKLPPYFDFAHYEEMARILLDFPIDFITCINSVWNTLILDPETHRPVIKPKWGFGWLGGHIIKPIALANVRKFYELVGHKIEIIAAGGIRSGIDGYEYTLCGASALQIGTEFFSEGYGIFSRVKSETQEYAQKQGWENIESARGKLEVLS